MTPVPEEVRGRLRERTTQQWSAPGVVDLGIGQPQDSLLPVDVLGAALRGVADAGRPHPLQYGIEAGDGDLRVAVAEFLEPSYGFCPDPDATFVTNGNSQAIDLVTGVLTRPGDVVLVEQATYFLALRIFRDHHVRIEPVAVDADGIVPEALEAALVRHRPTFVYVVPAFQNPTGATLSAGRREQVVDLVAEHGSLVVADEVYHLLSYDAAVPAPLADWAGSGVVLSLGTFSKILAPGLRLGWVHTSPDLADRLVGRGFVVSGGGLNPLVAATVTRVLDDGSAAAYLSRLRLLLRSRRDAMARALREHLPADVTWTTPAGGYFFWLTLPPTVDPVALREAARAHGVDYRPGSLFAVDGGLGDRLRLSFAYYDEAVLTAAVASLGTALTAVRGR